MPECGSQCVLCDLPIRFDNYEGCAHSCEYCFVKRKNTIVKIKDKESPQNLKDFIQGKRTENTKWCDWDIPIHWGGMSDPFQPIEKERQTSKECLKILAETQYPFVVSSKGRILGDEEYLKIIKDCNGVVQISLVCESYNILEKGCPSFSERLKIAEKVAKNAKRLIIRIQPYMHEVFEEVYNNLKLFADAGAYGVIVEGMKFIKSKPGLVRLGGDFVYPYDLIKNDIELLKQEAHSRNLKLFSGENRTRKLGDSLTCCGIEGLEGFNANKFNLNHILNGDKPSATQKQDEVGTALCFRGIHQTTLAGQLLKKQSFSYAMLMEYKNNPRKMKELFGIK